MKIAETRNTKNTDYITIAISASRLITNPGSTTPPPYTHRRNSSAAADQSR